MGKKFVSWRRVSTKKQGASGLGLQAQLDIIKYFVQHDGGELISDYSEVYTGKELSGCVELRKAIEHCKRENAILIIAKTDRFRNTIEALQVYEEMGDGNIMFCDLPHTDKFTLTLFFALAEREALIVSIRTKQALAVKKAKGIKLGAASDNYNITNEKAKERSQKAGKTRTIHVLEDADTVALISIMKQVFPKCAEVPQELWKTSFVTTRLDARRKVLTLMRNYKEIQNGKMFASWDFSDLDSVKLQTRLSSKMQSIIRMLTR